MEEAEVMGEKQSAIKSRAGFIDLPTILGLRDEKYDVLNEKTYKGKIDTAKKNMVERKVGDGSIGELFKKNEKENARTTVNNIITTNTSNSTTTKITDKPTPMKTDTIAQRLGY